MRILLSILVVSMLAQQCLAAGAVKAELLADVNEVKPGEAFTLGVLLRIEPQWHVYWINPGDSGLATAVKFDLPKGFEVGPVRFPVPRKIVLPGNIVNFGYEDEVLLTARVTPPKELAPATAVPVSASVKWLCCRNVCIPGKTSVSMTLTVGAEALSANQDLFKKWERRVPVPAHQSSDANHVVVDLEPSGVGTISITWEAPPKNVELFPFPSDALELKDVAVHTAGKQTLISFRLVVLAGQKPALDALPMVVAYDQGGSGAGVLVDVPLKTLEQKTK